MRRLTIRIEPRGRADCASPPATRRTGRRRQRRRHRKAADAAGNATIAEGLAGMPATASSSPPPSRSGSTRRSPGPARTPCSCPATPRSTNCRPARSTRLMKPECARAADRRADLSHPPRHDPCRRHRQGDRQRQGQGGAGDDGRRDADRDQGRRQDRPCRCRRGQGDRHPGPTTSVRTASSTGSTRS